MATTSAHNIRIRDLALRAELKLSEYGLFEADSGVLVVEREEDVYERLGLTWIPPTIREDNGEVEAALHGTVDWDDDFLAGFDVTVASIHSAFRQSRHAMTARMLRAIENPHVNIIGHPTGRTIGHRPPIDADWDEIFRAAARTGTALEVNSFPDRLDLNDELVRRARRVGVRFAISTDAHAVPHLDSMRFGVATAQRGWAERADVINTYSLAELRHSLAKSAPVASKR